MCIQSELTLPISLKPDHALRLFVDAGTSILITKGAVSVAEAPAWVGDQFLNQSTILYDGELYEVQRRGWIVLDARRSAEVLCQQRKASTTNLFTRWFHTLFSYIGTKG